MKFLMILLLLGNSDVRAFANEYADKWICNEMSSERQGASIHSCGVGIASNENDARIAAFDNSYAEFTRICDSSSDCANHNIITTPKRTTCEAVGSQYKCYRLIIYTIGRVRDTYAKAHKYMPFGGKTQEEIGKEVDEKFDKEVAEQEKKIEGWIKHDYGIQ